MNKPLDDTDTNQDSIVMLKQVRCNKEARAVLHTLAALAVAVMVKRSQL